MSETESEHTKPPKPRIGIALGSGAARGWAHIGVLQQLDDMGIRPDIVCGCSIGAVIGAAYAVDNLDTLEKRTLSLSKLEMVRYFELNTSFTGFARQRALREFFHQYVCAKQQTIGALKKRFGAVAADLHSGEEIWLSHGKVIDAAWASLALPGLFPPVAYQDRWLVDGGLVNAVPVSLCRDLGADIIIAVDLNNINAAEKRGSDIQKNIQKSQTAITADDTPTHVDDSSDKKEPEPSQEQQGGLLTNVADALRNYSSTLFTVNTQGQNKVIPGIIETVAGSIDVMQNSITRYRLMEDQPDLLLSPRVNKISLLEFYRAEEAIQEGRDCVLRMKAEIERVTKTV